MLIRERTKDTGQPHYVLLQTTPDELLRTVLPLHGSSEYPDAHSSLFNEESGRIHDCKNMQRTGYHDQRAV